MPQADPAAPQPDLVPELLADLAGASVTHLVHACHELFLTECCTITYGPTGGPESWRRDQVLTAGVNSGFADGHVASF